MTDPELIAVEVVYATAALQKLVEVRVAPGSRARDVVLASGLDQYFENIDLRKCPVGVFGREVKDDYAVRPGDRVEIYRPLLNEPREARRAAAERGATMGRKSGK